MAKLEFKSKTLEKLFRSYKWARNNSIQMLDLAIEKQVLDYKPASNKFSFQPILHQFQCLASTADTYYRQLTGAENKEFGVIFLDGQVVKKGDIASQDLPKILKSQLEDLEELFKDYSDVDFDNNIKLIQAICNHEYLHQGELIVLMRKSGVDLPDRFRQAFAL